MVITLRNIIVLGTVLVSVHAVNRDEDDSLPQVVRMLVNSEKSAPVPSRRVADAIKMAALDVVESAVLQKKAELLDKRAAETANDLRRAELRERATDVKKGAELKKMSAANLSKRLVDNQTPAVAQKRFDAIAMEALARREELAEGQEVKRKNIESVLREIDPAPIDGRRAQGEIKKATKHLRNAGRLTQTAKAMTRELSVEEDPAKRAVMKKRVDLMRKSAETERIAAAYNLQRLAHGQTPSTIKRRVCEAQGSRRSDC